MYTHILKLVSILVATGLGAILAAASSKAAGPGGDTEQFPDYFPSHTVIKCPFIPEAFASGSLPTCDGLPATCIGTEGSDLLIGSEEPDVILGLGGNDVIHGDAGDDVICAGPGNDSVLGAKGSDTIFGEEGDDFLFGAVGADVLDGGPGDYDVLWGGPGYDNLDGGPGDFDVCMLQREMGDYSPEGCNTVYPPPGYVHEDEPDPGVLRAAEPLKL